MSGVPKLVKDWRDVATDARKAAHARRLLNTSERWIPGAARLLKYISEFITLTCAPDLVAMRLFPNAKEITESFGAYNAVRYRLPEWKLSDPEVTMVAVGDGSTPRTAATFAMRSAWSCFSVDPNLKGGRLRWEAIDRLTVLQSRVEDVAIHSPRVILVAVHSHVTLSRALKAIAADEIAVVAMPCCVPQYIPGQEPDIEYDDPAVMSACRRIKIWKSVRI